MTTNKEFVVPTRCIKTLSNLSEWNHSQAYKDYMSFVLSVNEIAKTKANNVECDISENVAKLLGILNQMNVWIDEIPPCDQPQRFGNKSYRRWWERMNEQTESLLAPLLGPQFKGAVIEIQVYFHESFGNQTRIDYGTGHECHFVFFLCCLFKLNLLQELDKLAVVNKVFVTYLELCRKLQMVYHMEPAGSQGVWGLDDFQFIPFIWGSAQLIDHPELIPEHLACKDHVRKFENEYLFFGCISYILSVKTGPFAEHSHTLWGISSVPHWGKVNSGLLKMYQAEVLSKFPVVQHFVFGSLMSMVPAQK